MNIQTQNKHMPHTQKITTPPATKPVKPPPPSTPTQPRHRGRTIASAFFGFIAVWLILCSVLVLWLNRTLTNTDQYVSVVAPLVTEPVVQDFVAQKATDALVESGQDAVNQLAAQLLTTEQIAGKTSEQLGTQVRPVVEQNIRAVIASPEFAALWKQTNQNIHSQLVKQLEANTGDITLNFHPLITGTIDQLGTTKLGFVHDKLVIKENVGIVTISGDKLETMRTSYQRFKQALVVVIVLAAIALILCVALSVNHLKTLRRVAIATAIASAVAVILLSATSLIQPSGTDAAGQKLGIELVNAVTHPLRTSLIIVAITCAVVAVGSKIYSLAVAKKAPSPKRV